MKKAKTGRKNMNSTNHTDSKIKELFEKVIIADAGKSTLLTTIDKNCTSYYESPVHPGQAYYSFIDSSSQQGFDDYLGQFWKEQGNEVFASAASDISSLAFSLCEDPESQSEDVSPFIYAMY